MEDRVSLKVSTYLMPGGSRYVGCDPSVAIGSEEAQHFPTTGTFLPSFITYTGKCWQT